MAVALPPVEAPDQFPDLESEPGHVERALGRGVTADAIAVGHDEARLVESGGRGRVHCAMRDGYGTRNVFRRVGLGRPRVDHDHGLAVLEGYLQVPRIDLVGQFVGVMLDLIVHVQDGKSRVHQEYLSLAPLIYFIDSEFCFTG